MRVSNLHLHLGTYALFAAVNGVIIFPVVYFYFPETKKYSLEDLDLIFAVAHEQGVNPVKISKSGDIPEAGSDEAERILGRTPGRPNMGERKGSKVRRIVSREKEKKEVSHTENASGVKRG